MINRNFEYGETDFEKKIGRKVITRTDRKFRIENKKRYGCARCNKELTIFEHYAFICFCKRCAENGSNHMTLNSKGKIEVTN